MTLRREPTDPNPMARAEEQTAACPIQGKVALMTFAKAFIPEYTRIIHFKKTRKMKTKLFFIALAGWFAFPVNGAYGQESIRLNDKVYRFATESECMLSPEDKGLINRLAFSISEEYDRYQRLDLLLVDKDNAAVSQMAQVWMDLALARFELPGIQVRSAGLEPGRVQAEALKTFETWRLVVNPRPGQGVLVEQLNTQWSLKAKGIEDGGKPDLVLFVDSYCTDKHLEGELKGKSSLLFPLGPSPACLEGGQLDHQRLNAEVGARVMFLVRQLKLNQVQKEQVRKQRWQGSM